jgi:prophage tail gpP-like protein
MTSIRLLVDGVAYEGWSSVRVDRSLDQFAHSFDFAYSDHWSESTEQRAMILGASAAVEIDGERVITGWLDQVRYSISAGSAVGSAQGRSKTGDLADCSAVHKTGQWRNQTAKTIIADLVAPFGLPIVYDATIVDTVKIPRFDLDYGETVFEAIDRLARLRAFLPTSSADGGLKFVRISRTAGLRTVQLDLREAVRREYASGMQDRFSTYRIAAQTARSDPEENSRRAALEKFEAKDPNVKRYRPFVVSSETGAKQVELQAHAQWIANQRAAQTERVIYEMVGTHAPDKRLWEPGMLVGVDDRALGVNDIFCIAAVSLRADLQNVTTELQLVRPEVYGTEPISEKQLINKLKRL